MVQHQNISAKEDLSSKLRCLTWEVDGVVLLKVGCRFKIAAIQQMACVFHSLLIRDPGSGGCMSNFEQVSIDSNSPIQPICQFAEPFAFRASGLDIKTESGSIVSTAVGVRLDLEDLPSFTVVNQQYASWGVLFDNAVAICPSNPAYPPRSGVMVLLGAPQNGWLEATFLQPVQYVSSFITSSRGTVMQAFNSRNQLVAETETQAEPLVSPNSSHQYDQLSRMANLRLSLNASNICRITLHSFNGHLTVDDFCFCVS